MQIFQSQCYPKRRVIKTMSVDQNYLRHLTRHVLRLPLAEAAAAILATVLVLVLVLEVVLELAACDGASDLGHVSGLYVVCMDEGDSRFLEYHDQPSCLRSVRPSRLR